MGKKSRRTKNKVIILRTKEERITEINTIKNKLATLGLGEGISEIKEFYQEMDKFIETGDNVSEKISLLGFQRIIEYNFNNNKKYQLFTNLKYSEKV